MTSIGVTAGTICQRPELRALVESILGSVRFYDGGTLAAFLADADGALVGRELVDDALLAKLPKLRAVSVYGVGFDNLDVEACRARGVAFLVAPGVNADAVAEHTLGLIL